MVTVILLIQGAVSTTKYVDEHAYAEPSVFGRLDQL